MLTIIFGAGASHDITPVTAGIHRSKIDWKPPLTSALFAPESVWSVEGGITPLPRNLVPVLQLVRRQTEFLGIEGALERLKSEVGNDPKRWAQLLAVQEWLCRVLTQCTETSIEYVKGATTYVDLVSKLDHWQAQVNVPVNYITFNYDTLLERALEQCQTRPPSVHGFAFHEHFNVFKPHGSIDWSWEVRFDPERRGLGDRPFSQAERDSLTLHAVPARAEGSRVNGVDFATFPAVAIPVVSKSHSDFIFPPGRKEAMRSSLEKTTALLVIGWAGAEEHFMAEVSARLKPDVPALVVCGKGGDRACASLRERGKLTSVSNAKVSFSEFLHEDKLEEWLKGIAWQR